MTMAKIEQIEQLWRDLAKIDGDGSAAEAHLAAGRAIYIADDDTPTGLLIKGIQTAAASWCASTGKVTR
jgi:hypothetical protein